MGRSVTFGQNTAAPAVAPASAPLATQPHQGLSALGASIAHHTYKRGAGQGPFKLTQSAERALFGVRKAAEDIKLALGRIDHNAADLDGVYRGNERALLAGLEVLAAAAASTDEKAKYHLSQLKSGGAALERTTKHNDPRIGLKESLASIAKLARSLLLDLQYHQGQLQCHVTILTNRLAELDLVYGILMRAVSDAKHPLASSPSSPSSAPVTPRGIKSFAAPTRSSFASVASAALDVSDPHAPTSPMAQARWRKLRAVMALAVKSPSKGQPAFSPRVAVAGSTNVPWSQEEDFVLKELVKEHGLTRWTLVADALPGALMKHTPDSRPPRTSGLCKARWETLLNAYLSVAGVSGLQRTADLLDAARKASRDAEGSINEVAGRLTDAKSRLSLASRTAQKLVTSAAERRGWLREHTHVKLHGSSAEHESLRHVLDNLGPANLLARKLAEVENLKAGLHAGSTLAEELGLRELVIEVGRMAGGAAAVPRYFLKVRNQRTAEICLEWEEPRDQRRTNPAQHKTEEGDALTRKLHEGGPEGGGSKCGGSSSATSTPRSTPSLR